MLHIRFMGCSRRPFAVNIGPMLRNSYIIHYVIGGKGYYNGTPVCAGQGFLITPGHMEEYHADPADPWELVWVVSEDAAMDAIFRTFCADPQTGVFSYSYIHAAERVAQTMQLMPSRVVSSAELLELFLSLYKYQESSALEDSQPSRAKSYVTFALDYMRTNYERDITIRELTELLGVSQPYLFRVFKAATGVSPKKYLGDLRHLQAKKLLEETTLSITEVAASVGYSDVLAFSRFFSAKEKKSPLQYRRDMKA